MEEDSGSVIKLQQRRNFPRKKSVSHNKEQEKKPQEKKTRGSQGQKCYKCGDDCPHEEGPCPAKNRKCYECGKMRHFGKYCKSGRAKRRQYKQQVANAIEKDDNSDRDSGYTFSVNSVNEKTPTTDITVNNIKVNFLIDSGANVNIIDSKTFEKLSKSSNVVLSNADTKLYAYGSKETCIIVGQI